ncbi:hypothetical protein IFM89_010653 [Coptis chinensis]|uniref:Transposase-associated domain-containing protein n=1 Tax=Coptis chinensis TaxID=261450 RepID=A0A835INZ3_9MAGN|nr:hypothetical protein IFM89_010653 [Coptis chinensis]
MSQPIQKDWILEPNRLSTVYRQGVDDFIDLAKEKYEGFTTCPCPCTTCRDGKRLVFDEARRHIVQNSFDLTYTVWSLHGEMRSKYPVVHIVGDENIEDRGLGLRNLVDASYGVHEGGRVMCMEGMAVKLLILNDLSFPNQIWPNVQYKSVLFIIVFASFTVANACSNGQCKGSAISSILGEANINLTTYITSKSPVPVSLPLKKNTQGTILQTDIDSFLCRQAWP